MEKTVGAKALLWSAIGAELTTVVYDLRYMVMLSLVLICADLWWGFRDSKVKYQEAVAIGKAVLIDKYKWHKSKAIRRTCNKLVDYMTYLIVGALLGLAITEPMGWCSHVVTACVGLSAGCLAEIASIVGHVVYVKFGIELKITDVWRWLLKFFVALVKKKSQEVGEAIEETFDNEQNTEG